MTKEIRMMAVAAIVVFAVGYFVGMMDEFFRLKPGETVENVLRYNSAECFRLRASPSVQRENQCSQ